MNKLWMALLTVVDRTSDLLFGISRTLLKKSLSFLEDIGRALPDQPLHPIVIVIKGNGEQENEPWM